MNIGIIIKVSKLCNLRCVYCCETPELSNKARMSVDDIERLFIHIRDFLLRWKEDHNITFYWHGGEPFAQPIPYWESILERQRQVFVEASNISILNTVQSNITLLTEKHLPLLRNFRIGFSFDVINDQRVNAGGQSTAELVKDKVQWLRLNGIGTAGIAVISQTNVNNGKEVVDYYIAEKLCFRLIHLDEGLDQIPQIRPVAVSFPIYVRFLLEVYDLPEVRWALQKGLRIDPISTAAAKFQLWQQGHQSAEPGEDLSEAEYLLEVNTDGETYSPADYPYQNSYGNIFKQSLEVLLASQGRNKRIERSRERLEKVCENCFLFRRGCNGTFVSHATPEQYVEIEQLGGCYLHFLATRMRLENQASISGEFNDEALAAASGL